MEFTELAQYGSTGVAIALVIAIYLIVKMVLKFFGNHVDHNTQAVTTMIEVIRELKDYLRSSNGK